MKKIGIQGIKGSFHHEVAELLYEETSFEVIPFHTFDGLAKAVVDGSIAEAVIDIENSIAGYILPATIWPLLENIIWEYSTN